MSCTREKFLSIDFPFSLYLFFIGKTLSEGLGGDTCQTFRREMDEEKQLSERKSFCYLQSICFVGVVLMSNEHRIERLDGNYQSVASSRSFAILENDLVFMKLCRFDTSFFLILIKSHVRVFKPKTRTKLVLL